ncbi:MAG: single-stranded-DNA-specific exonuclease RecJ, partial [Spirochaetia bacterium]|nr:single-stranded-DNA-specific exonuclease RecJ [Spirochaetia bacterium]
MKQWVKEAVSVDSLRSLHDQFGIDYIKATLLSRRGVSEKEQLKYFLETDLSFLHNPFLFDDMESFVMRVLEAKREGEKVRIFGDRDVDGITSTSLLVEFLTSQGIETSWRLPQGDEPYGLTSLGIDEAHSEDVTLIITVDCGISNIDEVEYASSLGIDVLITDHHLAGEYVPDAHSIIDPKIEECNYPFTHLAGCGVVAKVIWALGFGLSDAFQEEVLLIHTCPGNSEKGKETFIIEAVKMRNLIETERMVEEVVPGALAVSQSRIIKFLNCNLPIFALDVEVENRILHAAFLSKVDIHLIELRPLFIKTIPQVGEKSLFALSQMSKSVKYSAKMSELDVLISLFSTHVIRLIPYLRDEYHTIFDLVALGTIADLMPMADENRIMVKHGLNLLTSGNRKSLIPLLTHQNLLGKRLSTTDVGWQITPIINASGRMGTPEVALIMLLSTNYDEASLATTELLKLNSARQKEGEKSWNKILPKAKKSCDDFDNKFLMVEDKEVNRGLTGIMASRLLKQFKVPSMVIAYIDESRITGSLRSPTYFNIRDFLSDYGDLFLDYGGHRCAGGFSMEIKNLPLLKERMKETIAALNAIEEVEERVTIDLELPPHYLSPKIIEIVELIEPYGEGNPPIHFMISKAIIEEMKVLQNNKSTGANHVKLTLSYGSYKWPAL